MAEGSTGNTGGTGGRDRHGRRVIGTPTEAEPRLSTGGSDSQDVPSPYDEYAIEEEGVHASVDEVQPRPSRSADPKAQRRAERTAASLFLLGGAAGLGFMLAIIFTDVGSVVPTSWSTRWLGLTMAVAFLAFGAGITVWVRNIMPDEEVVQEREELPSSMEEKKEFSDYFMTGAKATGITKRPMLRRSLLAGLVPLGVAPLFLLRGLGKPYPYDQMHHTVWKKGMRLVKYGTEDEPVKPAELAKPGSILTVIPEGYGEDLNVLADATVQIIKFRTDELKPPTNLDWVVDGIVAYSKICTHVGCATGLYEDTTHNILCPCHQSTFDAAHGCRVIFGPASRPLPQLPLGVNKDGHLIAMGDFPEPVGPNFWGRG